VVAVPGRELPDTDAIADAITYAICLPNTNVLANPIANVLANPIAIADGYVDV
jgi:inorganic pyrophosphatase/exopolyphosphatase